MRLLWMVLNKLRVAVVIVLDANSLELGSWLNFIDDRARSLAKHLGMIH